MGSRIKNQMQACFMLNLPFSYAKLSSLLNTEDCSNYEIRYKEGQDLHVLWCVSETCTRINKIKVPLVKTFKNLFLAKVSGHIWL